MLTFALVGATRAERARRLHQQAAAEAARLKAEAARTASAPGATAKADAGVRDQHPPAA